MDDQFTINDLPVECVDQILKCITDQVDRVYARFVCKFWCALIDEDCSTELYQINAQRMDIERFYNDKEYKDVKLRNILSPLINSGRKKTSFLFKYFDLREYEQLFRMKGAGIISLNFGTNTSNIPLQEIVEHCSDLRTLTILVDSDCDSYREYELDFMLEKCVANGKRNYSVRTVHLRRQPLDDVINIITLVSQVFPGVKNVFSDGTYDDYWHDFDWASKMNSFSTAFRNLEFVITLSNDVDTYIFDDSGNVSVKMTTLSIDSALDSNILTLLSSNPCDYKHLNELKLTVRDHFYVLDHLKLLISECPTLKSICVSIKSGGHFVPLTNSLGKNNIKELNLSNSVYGTDHRYWHVIIINDQFLQSFGNLKSFECDKLVFSDFVKLLHKLPNLEKLIVCRGIVDINPEELMISHKKLHKLSIPELFILQTNTKYVFGNLREFNLWPSVRESYLSAHNLVEHLSRMNCPKLEEFFVYVYMPDENMSPEEFTQWAMNILVLFPKLIKFYFHGDITNEEQSNKIRMEVADEILKTILASHRRLRQIGTSMVPHILNITSPSHIKHGCIYGESVLYMP